jgi:hypothetical protein
MAPMTDIVVGATSTDTRVCVWSCRICGKHASFVSPATDQQAAAAEAFVATAGWRFIRSDDVVCDRCKLLPEVAHLILAQEKARTQ